MSLQSFAMAHVFTQADVTNSGASWNLAFNGNGFAQPITVAGWTAGMTPTAFATAFAAAFNALNVQKFAMPVVAAAAGEGVVVTGVIESTDPGYATMSFTNGNYPYWQHPSSGITKSGKGSFLNTVPTPITPATLSAAVTESLLAGAKAGLLIR